MKQTIQITENDLKNIVLESVNKLLREYIEIAKNVPVNIQKQYLAKVKKERSDLDPTGFSYVGNKLIHNGKKVQKREKIVRKQGESTNDFLKRVAVNDERIMNMLNHEQDQEFRNIENILTRFGYGTSSYLDYEVSDKGVVRVVNNTDGGKSIEPKIYLDRHGEIEGDYQVHLGSENCPVVKNLVAFAFPDIVQQPFNLSDYSTISKLPFVVVHKDGNKENNEAINLEWKPKKRLR